MLVIQLFFTPGASDGLRTADSGQGEERFPDVGGAIRLWFGCKSLG